MVEQLAIVEYIADSTVRLDNLRAATERTISLLKERRAALIAAAITGQIDTGACTTPCTRDLEETWSNHDETQ